MSSQDLQKFVHAFITSKLHYCGLLTCLPKNSMQRLLVQNAGARVLTKLIVTFAPFFVCQIIGGQAAKLRDNLLFSYVFLLLCCHGSLWQPIERLGEKL